MATKGNPHHVRKGTKGGQFTSPTGEVGDGGSIDKEIEKKAKEKRVKAARLRAHQLRLDVAKRKGDQAGENKEREELEALRLQREDEESGKGVAGGAEGRENPFAQDAVVAAARKGAGLPESQDPGIKMTSGIGGDSLSLQREEEDGKKYVDAHLPEYMENGGKAFNGKKLYQHLQNMGFKNEPAMNRVVGYATNKAWQEPKAAKDPAGGRGGLGWGNEKPGQQPKPDTKPIKGGLGGGVPRAKPMNLGLHMGRWAEAQDEEMEDGVKVMKHPDRPGEKIGVVDGGARWIHMKGDMDLAQGAGLENLMNYVGKLAIDMAPTNALALAKERYEEVQADPFHSKEDLRVALVEQRIAQSAADKDTEQKDQLKQAARHARIALRGAKAAHDRAKERYNKAMAGNDSVAKIAARKEIIDAKAAHELAKEDYHAAWSAKESRLMEDNPAYGKLAAGGTKYEREQFNARMGVTGTNAKNARFVLSAPPTKPGEYVVKMDVHGEDFDRKPVVIKDFPMKVTFGDYGKGIRYGSMKIPSTSELEKHGGQKLAEFTWPTGKAIEEKLGIKDADAEHMQRAFDRRIASIQRQQMKDVAAENAQRAHRAVQNWHKKKGK